MNAPTELTVKVSQPLAEAREFRVQTREQYVEAGERLKAIKALRAEVDKTFDPIIQKAHAAHKEAVGQKKLHETPLIEAEGLYKRALLAYDQEQERIRLKAQAEAEERARKERERLERQAAKAAEQGKPEKAAELETRAQTVATPVIASSTPRLAGISTRVSWRAELVSKALLIEAVAGGRRLQPGTRYVGTERRRPATAPQMALEANDTFLGQQARSLKSELNYPGIRVFEDRGVSSRSA